VCPGEKYLSQIGASLPTPTAQYSFRALNITGASNATVYDAATALTQRITNAGYPAPRYLGIGCQGVAVAATFEKIDKVSGKRTANNPFVAPSANKLRNKGAWSFVVGLFSAPTGYYRRIIFLITDEAPPKNSGTASAEVVDDIFEDGSATLPKDYRQVSLTQQYKVHAYVYEFAKEAGAEPTLYKGTGTPPNKGILTINQHLTASGLFQSLP
jgi:hypothetical protein